MGAGEGGDAQAWAVAEKAVDHAGGRPHQAHVLWVRKCQRVTPGASSCPHHGSLWLDVFQSTEAVAEERDSSSEGGGLKGRGKERKLGLKPEDSSWF